MVQRGFFDVDEPLAVLSAAGDPLERLSAVVDFELFRPVLGAALSRSDRSRGARPPYDAVLMFKALVLQALYNLSDDESIERLIEPISCCVEVILAFLGFVEIANAAGLRARDRRWFWRRCALYQVPLSITHVPIGAVRWT